MDGNEESQRRQERKTERGNIPPQKHPSRSAEAAPGTIVAFLVAFLGGWLAVDEEERPSRRSSSQRTAPQGGGAGMVAFQGVVASEAFPSFLLCWLR